jgi:hypothetical protein
MASSLNLRITSVSPGYISIFRTSSNELKLKRELSAIARSEKEGCVIIDKLFMFSSGSAKAEMRRELAYTKQAKEGTR